MRITAKRVATTLAAAAVLGATAGAVLGVREADHTTPTRAVPAEVEISVTPMSTAPMTSTPMATSPEVPANPGGTPDAG